MITIEKSVGRNGVNSPVDVLAIGTALVAIQPQRGGVLVPPVTTEELGNAIEHFQRHQSLPYIDGRVDPGGKTLQRINEILFPVVTPAAGGIRPLDLPGAETAVNKNTWTPVESSLVTDYVFQWTNVSGSGRIYYFQLDETVAPRWFGVLVPDGPNNYDRLHLFFHPTPGQAGYQDANYHSLANWPNIFHYLREEFAAQFCAAGTGRVLLMPLMTQAAASDAGILPQRWEAIASRILGMLKSGDFTATAPPSQIQDVVVSSFSSGIVYSHVFRQRAQLGAKLAGVIDFDGIISSYSQYSASLSGPPGRVVRMQQMPATEALLGTLASQNIYPLSKPRWGPPWDQSFDANAQTAMLQIHGTIPQTTMYLAAQKAG